MTNTPHTTTEAESARVDMIYSVARDAATLVQDDQAKDPSHDEWRLCVEVACENCQVHLTEDEKLAAQHLTWWFDNAPDGEELRRFTETQPAEAISQATSAAAKHLLHRKSSEMADLLTEMVEYYDSALDSEDFSEDLHGDFQEFVERARAIIYPEGTTHA